MFDWENLMRSPPCEASLLSYLLGHLAPALPRLPTSKIKYVSRNVKRHPVAISRDLAAWSIEGQ